LNLFKIFLNFGAVIIAVLIFLFIVVPNSLFGGLIIITFLLEVVGFIVYRSRRKKQNKKTK